MIQTYKYQYSYRISIVYNKQLILIWTIQRKHLNKNSSSKRLICTIEETLTQEFLPQKIKACSYQAAILE